MLEILSVEIREVELLKNDSGENDYIRQWDEFIELMRRE